MGLPSLMYCRNAPTSTASESPNSDVTLPSLPALAAPAHPVQELNSCLGEVRLNHMCDVWQVDSRAAASVLTITALLLPPWLLLLPLVPLLSGRLLIAAPAMVASAASRWSFGTSCGKVHWRPLPQPAQMTPGGRQKRTYTSGLGLHLTRVYKEHHWLLDSPASVNCNPGNRVAGLCWICS